KAFGPSMAGAIHTISVSRGALGLLRSPFAGKPHRSSRRSHVMWFCRSLWERACPRTRAPAPAMRHGSQGQPLAARLIRVRLKAAHPSDLNDSNKTGHKMCPGCSARSSKNCPSHSGNDLEATVTGFGMLELVAAFICLTTLLTYVNYRFIGLPP